MRLIPLLAAALALVAPGAALAGSEEITGYYDGPAKCADGDTQLTLIIEVDDDNGVTGSLTVNPYNRATKLPPSEYKVEGTLTGGDMLDLAPGDWVKHPAGAQASRFYGTWFEAGADSDITIIGHLDGLKCGTFTLTRDAMASDL